MKSPQPYISYSTETPPVEMYCLRLGELFKKFSVGQNVLPWLLPERRVQDGAWVQAVYFEKGT